MDGVPAPGTVLADKYRVERELGRGGMGVVLLVTHLQLGEQLALKLLLPAAAANHEVSARFLREAQSAVRLRGENVTRVSDIGMLPGGLPYIAMEYLRGTDLSGELGRRRMLPPGEAVDYVLQACEALAEAHAIGIVHRDIKAANLFLTTRPDGTAMIKVLDFGISKAPVAMGAMVTKTDIVMGTPGYMSPEQMRAVRDVDGRADIWALGIVLYECLNGRRPFDAETFSAAVLRAGTEPPPPMEAHVPKKLQGVVLRCLEKDRAARFPSVAALAGALAPLANDKRAAAMIADRTSAISRRASAAEPAGSPGPGGQASVAAPLAAAAPAPAVRPPDIVHRAPAQPPAAITHAAAVPPTAAPRLPAAYPANVQPQVPAQFPVPAQRPIPTTLSAGSGSMGASRAPRRRLIGGAFVAAGVVGLLVIAIWAAEKGSGSDAAASAGGDAGSATVASLGSGGSGSASVVPLVIGSGGDAGRENTAVVHAVVVPDPAAKPVDEAASVEECVKRQASRDWQGLMDCAKHLDEVGDHDKAKQYRETALREQKNALIADELQQQLRERNLKDAAATFAKITADSVYFVSMRDAFIKAESEAIETARKTAHGLASAHDCASLRTLYRQLVATGTPKVAAAVTPIKCVEKNDATIDPPAGSASAQVTLPAQPRCDKVDDLIGQAENQFHSDAAPAALQLMVEALLCRQTLQMYKLATLYACAARDAAYAKTYIIKIPTPSQQAPFIQRCLQVGIDLRSP